ncbi:MAG: hypothetical protein ACJ8KX_04370 [Chthoniobacterales bacterium]
MKTNTKQKTQPTLPDQALAAPDPTPGYKLTKVSVSFLTADPDPTLTSRVSNIVYALTDNEYYTGLQADLPAIATANGDFANAIAAAADGGKQLNAAKRAARAALVSLVRPLGGKVQLACQNNMTILLSSGFPVQKPNRTPAQIPATPITPAVSQGLTGQAYVVTGRVEGAYVYNWRVALADTPETFIQHAQSTGGRVTIDSLTPGKICLFQANAVGTAGTSDWSNAGSLMVI